jgi:hypothetical protein
MQYLKKQKLLQQAQLPQQHSVFTNAAMPQQVMPPKSDVLICDGIERTIVVPIQVNPYTLPTGMSCSRAAGGVCAALKSVVCLPYTDINGLLGPVTYGDTQAQSAPLLVHPDNPLVFTMDRGYYMTYVSWTANDVGTGGARMVAKYPPGAALKPDVLAHNWTAAPGTVDGAGNCDACSDCTLGKGIKDMKLKARPGTGYSSFELSQLFGSPRCGKSCFDLDGSYWTGMAYSCVKVGACISGSYSACVPKQTPLLLLSLCSPNPAQHACLVQPFPFDAMRLVCNQPVVRQVQAPGSQTPVRSSAPCCYVLLLTPGCCLATLPLRRVW